MLSLGTAAFAQSICARVSGQMVQESGASGAGVGGKGRGSSGQMVQSSVGKRRGPQWAIGAKVSG